MVEALVWEVTLILSPVTEKTCFQYNISTLTVDRLILKTQILKMTAVNCCMLQALLLLFFLPHFGKTQSSGKMSTTYVYEEDF